MIAEVIVEVTLNCFLCCVRVEESGILIVDPLHHGMWWQVATAGMWP